MQHEQAREKSARHLYKPASPIWIFITLAISYLLNLIFAASQVEWMPDLVAITLLFWSINQSRSVGVTIAFFVGILTDVQNGSVLGQQALSYVALTFLGWRFHRRIATFDYWGQAIHILPIFFVAQLIVLFVRVWFDGLWPGVVWFTQTPIATLLWPFMSFCWHFPQRYAKAKDDM